MQLRQVKAYVLEISTEEAIRLRNISRGVVQNMGSLGLPDDIPSDSEHRQLLHDLNDNLDTIIG